MKLNDLKIDDQAIITKVKASDNIKRRLLDMGFVRGVIIQKVLVSSGDNMVGYFIKGSVVAIRKDDTKDIEVVMLK